MVCPQVYYLQFPNDRVSGRTALQCFLLLFTLTRKPGFSQHFKLSDKKLFSLQEKASAESRHLSEIASLKDRNLHLETKADELDKRCQSQQDQIYELKEELATSHAQIKLQATQAEGRQLVLYLALVLVC